MEPTTEQMQELKAIELDMLRAFIDVCKKLGLRYYLLCGTLLGAVRHQGFIPWDDDIDVGMLRADYEVFLEKGQTLLPKNLFIQCTKSEPEYLLCFAKIRNSATTFIETDTNHLRINGGIFIDVFPLDYYPDDSKKQKLIDRKSWIYMHAVAVFFNFSKKYSVMAYMKAWVLRTFHPIVRMVILGREKLYRSVPQSGFLASYGGGWGKKEIVPADWYGEGTTLFFEGLEVTAPAQYEKYLTQVYGDYMQLPPVEKRVTHHYTDVIDSHRPYTEYIKTKK